MKNFSTWLLVMFMGLFWLFRVAVAFTGQMNIDFGGIEPLNIQMEVILLFVVLLCMVLIAKRKIVGALIYLVGYGLYFGTNVVTGIINIMNTEVSMTTTLDTLIAFIGIILPIAVLIDLLVDKGRKANPKDKKTDWFYKNEQFDRKMDDRADKNNYRTM